MYHSLKQIPLKHNSQNLNIKMVFFSQSSKKITVVTVIAITEYLKHTGQIHCVKLNFYRF